MEQLELSQLPMFRSLSDILGNVVPRNCIGLGFDEWPELLERAGSGFETEKALQAVVSILQYLEDTSPEALAPITKILADGSRYEPLRLPFGDMRVLDFYLDLLSKDADEHDWTSDALRLVGNTCADLDINRERALAKLKLPALLRRLTEEDKANVALGVLYNLCLDYEPAQVLLRANRLFSSIIQLLERRYYNSEFLPQVSLLLDIAVEDLNPELYPSTEAIDVIYQAIAIPGVDIETQISLANAFLAILKHEQIQKALIRDDKVILVLDLFEFSYIQDATSTNRSRSKFEPQLHRPVRNSEDEAEFTALRSALSAKLWDMTALAEFTAKYPPASEPVQRLISWLSIDEPQMQVCACSILRNVASSDKNATDMVMKSKIHHSLIHLLNDSSNLQVLEESVRLMKNLAVPVANKEDLECFESITLLWTKFESPTLHYAAVSLVRLLLRGCFGNVYRFLRPSISAEDDSCVSRFLRLYSNTDDLAIKTEVARTIVEIWRTANSGDGQAVRSLVAFLDKALREANLGPAEMVEPVVVMLVKSENSSLVTEGWFGLTLMASSEDWSEAIYNTLSSDETEDVFKAAISNPDAHSKDRDNARILADRLMKHSADNPARVDALRALVPKGA